MANEQYQVRVNRVEGVPVRLFDAPPTRVGYVYAEDEDRHAAMFWSEAIDQYRIGDQVRIEVTRLDD